MSIAGTYKLLGAAALAATLGLPAVTTLAESMSNTNVGVRSTDALSRDLGREGSDAYVRERQPSDPPAPIVKAYNATKEFVTQPPREEGVQRYGRAGGYVGLDVLASPLWSKSPSNGG